jgi:hypothetical protein
LKRNLLLLNLALLVLVSFLGWYLRKRWIESRDHEHKVLTAAVRPAPVAPPPPLKKVEPIEAPAYSVVVEKQLFTADRNPTPIVEPPPPPPAPPPMPPLPAAHGVMMWDGVPPTVLLSERGRSGQKGYHPGDKIGQFTIVSVSNKEVVFDWNGKEVAARLDDMMQKGLMSSNNNSPGPNTPGQPQGSSEGTTQKPGTPLPSELMKNTGAQAPAQASQVTSLGNDPTTNQGSSLGPGPELPGQGIRTCVAGDSSPPGTVVNGLQKKVNTTPFGVVCRWEPK